MPYTDANGNKRMWYPDMAVRQTISQVMTTSLADKRHRVGLLISPLPWVGITPEVGSGEDGEEFIAYPPGHVALLLRGILAKPWRSGTATPNGRSAARPKSGRCGYHCGFAKASPESNPISIST